LKNDSESRLAVVLAKRNWQVQKEPADLRILLESGIAAKDAEALAMVRAWIAQSKIEDPATSAWLRASP
jgi:hypothetical protein